MNNNIYSGRIEKVKEEMAKAGIDAFFISPSSDLFYLSGCALGGDERLFLLVLPVKGGPFLLANLLYKRQTMTLPVPVANDQIFWKDGEDPFSLLKAQIEKRNISLNKVALEPEIPALFSLPLSKTFPSADFVLGSSIIDPIRQYKDETEINTIRRACKESDRALGAVIERGEYWIGKTESAFLSALSAEISLNGIYDFAGSVQAGANAAIPHYVTGGAVIEKGKCLLCDFWGRFQGYYTDCTRTFHFGKPEAEFEKIYNIVLEAHLAAEAKALSGNLLEDVDIAARSVITKYGYGEYFIHRTGHGLGIDDHEGDSVNTGVKVPIKPGMVFSIEPGIYIPGRFGVRIENLVAIRENGSEILHNYPRELKVIG